MASGPAAVSSKPRKQNDGEDYQEARHLVCERLRADLGTTVGRTVLAEILKLGTATQNTLIENYNSAYEGAAKNGSPDAAAADNGADDDFKTYHGFSSWTEWRHSISEARKRNLQFRNSYRERTQGVEEKLNDLNEWLDSTALPAYPNLRAQNRDALRRIVCQWPTLSLSERRIVENAKAPWHDIRKARQKFRAADLAAQRATGTLLTGTNDSGILRNRERDSSGEGPARKKVRFEVSGELPVPREDLSEVDPWFSAEAKAEAARVEKKWDKILHGDKHRRRGSEQKTGTKESVFAAAQLPVASTAPAPSESASTTLCPVPTTSAVPTHASGQTVAQASSWSCLQSGSLTVTKDSACGAAHPPTLTSVRDTSRPPPPVTGCVAALTHFSERKVVRASSWGCLQFGSLTVTQGSACDAAHSLIQTSARNTPGSLPLVAGCTAKAPARATSAAHTTAGRADAEAQEATRFFEAPRSSGPTEQTVIEEGFITEIIYDPEWLKEGKFIRVGERRRTTKTPAQRVGAKAKKATRFFEAPRSSRPTEQTAIEERLLTEIIYDPEGLKEGKFIRVGERRRTVREVQVEDRFVTEAVYDPAGVEEGKFIQIGERRRTIREIFGTREKAAAAARATCSDEASAVRASAIARANYDEDVAEALREEEARLAAGTRRACPPQTPRTPATATTQAEEEEEDLWPGYSDPEVLEIVAESKARGYAHEGHPDYHAHGVSDHISRAQHLVYKARSKARAGGRNTLVPVNRTKAILKAPPKVVLKAAAKPSPTSRNPGKAAGAYHKLNQPCGFLDSESPVPTGIFAREPTKEEKKLFEQKAAASRELKRKARAIRGFITDTVEAAEPEPVTSSEAVAEALATTTGHVDAGAASSAPTVAVSTAAAAEPREETLEDLSRELDDAIQGFEKLIKEDE
eukprot:g14207.t1